MINLAQFTNEVAAESGLSPAHCTAVLSGEIELLTLLDTAFKLRQKYFGRDVYLHILNNVQNGGCGENCQYCAQSCNSQAPISSYPQKSDSEIFMEAEQAYRSGAFRHCLVFAGNGLDKDRTEHLANIVRELKKRYSMQICVSPGFINEEQARILKNAGLDRLNHNLNTSERNYPAICTTHSYDDRLNTLKAAKSAGLEVCSGIIIGMGEKPEDIIDVALALNKLKASSIPVNFLLPIPGIGIKNAGRLTPEYCLRVLCLFRFLNPAADVRVAAGREFHLRSMEVLSLYPANSLFLDGYLNAKGSSRKNTLQMIKDAGFTIKSDHSLDALLLEDGEWKEEDGKTKEQIVIKDQTDLRQFLA